jgi:preprotein translocase subunit SecD
MGNPSSHTGTQEKKSRFTLDSKMQKIFADLYKNHNGGEFAKVVMTEQKGKNDCRQEQWDSFTEAFNTRANLKSPNKAPKAKLQRYLRRLQVKTSKAMAACDDPSLRYR